MVNSIMCPVCISIRVYGVCSVPCMGIWVWQYRCMGIRLWSRECRVWVQGWCEPRADFHPLAPHVASTLTPHTLWIGSRKQITQQMEGKINLKLHFSQSSKESYLYTECMKWQIQPNKARVLFLILYYVFCISEFWIGWEGPGQEVWRKRAWNDKYSQIKQGQGPHKGHIWGREMRRITIGIGWGARSKDGFGQRNCYLVLGGYEV